MSLRVSRSWLWLAVAGAVVLVAAIFVLASRPVAGATARNGFVLAKVSGKFQTVDTAISASAYAPIAVQKGIPVRWTIRAGADDLNRCNETIVASDFGIRKTLVLGKNLVEFTPDRSGTFIYKCWMDMIGSRILVVDDISKPLPEDLALPGPSGTGSSPGTVLAGGTVPTGEIALARLDGEGQAVELRVAGDGFHPAILVLQRDRAAAIRFLPSPDVSPGDSIIEFPGHEARVDLTSADRVARFGEVLGDFTFRSVAGRAQGYVKVVDDIRSVDLEALRKQVEAYRPSGEGIAPCCGY